MPILNWQHPPGIGQQILANFGPRIQVEVSLHPAAQQALADAGQAIPASVNGAALIDTGATVTAIDHKAATTLGLRTVGRKPILTPAGQSDTDQFSFMICVLPYGLKLNCVPGIGADLDRQGLVALIGMDMLAQCVLTVNGPGGFFFLSH